MKRTLTLLLPAVLSACSTSYNTDDGQGSAPASCTTISGGGTTVAIDQTACPGCQVSNAEQGIDGDTSTAASLTSAVSTAGFSGLRATAQDGVVYPAGGQAGVIAAINRVTNAESGSIILRTYLQGQVQEESTVTTNGVFVNGISQGQVRRFSFLTTEPFDAVAFGLFGAANNLDIDYYEFCSDH